jgi:hypothetical protein
MKSIMAYGGIAGMGAGANTEAAPIEPQKIEVINKVPGIFLNVMRDQFRVLQTWVDPIIKLSEVLPEADDLMKAMQKTHRSYDKMLNQIKEKRDEQ